MLGLMYWFHNLKKSRPAKLGLAVGFYWLQLAFYFFSLSTASWCADLQIAVVYPDMRKPYSIIFEEIMTGIDQSLAQNISQIKIAKKNDIQLVVDWLEKKDHPIIVALGHKAVISVQSITPNINLIFSAVTTNPNALKKNEIIVDYTPAPAELFARLKTLAPRIKTIHTILNPQENLWLVEHIQLAATKNGLTVKIHQAGSLKESGLMYQQLLVAINNESDAVWLPQDPTTINNQVTLPLLLEQAWQHKVLLFSSSLNHVDKGVLFALYPDNTKLGQRLGRLALEIGSGKYTGPNFMLLQELKLAVNIRTAKHLGLEFDRNQMEQFDLVLPK